MCAATVIMGSALALLGLIGIARIEARRKADLARQDPAEADEDPRYDADVDPDAGYHENDRATRAGVVTVAELIERERQAKVRRWERTEPITVGVDWPPSPQPRGRR